MKITIKNGVTIINTGDAVGGIKTVSGHTGVIWQKDRKTYRAEIYINRKRMTLGQFTDIDKAIALRKEAEKHRAAGSFEEWYKTLIGVTRRKPPTKR